MTTTALPIRRTRGYRVKPGCSIMAPNGSKQWLAGAVIPDGALTQKQIQEHIDSGFLGPTTIKQSFENDTLVEKAPGMVEPAMVGMEEEIETFDNRAVRISGQPIKMEMKPIKVKSNSPVSRSSLWDLDPADLKGKELSELNVMVRERDAGIALFDTEEEAIAHLSLDFEG